MMLSNGNSKPDDVLYIELLDSVSLINLVTLLTLIHPEQQLPVHHRPLLVQLLPPLHWISVPS